MKNPLLDKIQKAGTIKESAILSKSDFFNKKDNIPTEIPIINIALSGTIQQGLTSGLTFFAGPSRHFKSLLGLLLVKAYLTQYSDAICLFYDSEFGITPQYLQTNGIDTERVIHTPVVHLEELKFDLVQRLEQIERGDKVIIFIDSIGNLASKKEVEDAINEKSVADMTRAKSMKGLFRIVTPHFTRKDIPCIVVNHVYDEMGLYPKQIMGGGQGPMLSANQVFFIGKAQEKDGKDIIGYHFTINVEKSRFVREKSKFPFSVTYENGIEKYSGLMDIALEAGVVIKPNQGFYQKIDLKTGEPEGNKMRLKDTNTKEFWDSILQSKEFNDYIKQRYQLGYNSLIADDVSNNFIENSKNEENENDQTRFE